MNTVKGKSPNNKKMGVITIKNFILPELKEIKDNQAEMFERWKFERR